MWPLVVMWIATLIVVAVSAIYVFKSCMAAPGKITKSVVDNVSQTARDLAATFAQGTVSIEFREYCTEVQTNLSLQVATLKKTEQFIRTDEQTIGWGWVHLPDVVLSVTAPVDYTYYVDLNQHWNFQLKDQMITAVVPDPQFNRPAFDVSRMEWDVKKDSALRRTQKVKEDFEHSLMPLAIKRAREQIKEIKEPARAQVTAFLQTWLRQRFIDGHKYQIKVVFESENRLGSSIDAKPE